MATAMPVDLESALIDGCNLQVSAGPGGGQAPGGDRSISERPYASSRRFLPGGSGIAIMAQRDPGNPGAPACSRRRFMDRMPGRLRPAGSRAATARPGRFRKPRNAAFACKKITVEMDIILKLAPIFAAVFLAELGDKTQLATLLFASDQNLKPGQVFFAAATALVLSTGLAVLVGNAAARHLEMLPLKLIAGIGFIAIGCWALVEHFRGG